MAATKGTIFYFSDWLSDPAVRACSLAARGLWIDMLGIMETAPQRGYLMVGQAPIHPPVLARMVGASTEEVESLLKELLHRAVYNVDRRGVIYSRRMVREEKKRRSGRDGGKIGGPVTLEKGLGIHASRGDTRPPAGKPITHTHTNRDSSSPSSSTIRGGVNSGSGRGGAGGGGDTAPNMPTSERMARFAAKLAQAIDRSTRSQQGASIVAVAQDQTHPDHHAAIEACQSAAQALGKGWPRLWPTDRPIPS